MSQRPRVLLLLRSYPPDASAAGRLAAALANFLATKGWQVDVVCASASGIRVEPGNPSILRAWSPPYTRRSHALRALSLVGVYHSLAAKAWQAPRPDVLLTLTDPPLLSVLGVLLARLWRCPHVHWCQDVYPEVAEAAGVFLPVSLARRLSTWSLRRTQAVVSVGRCMTRLLEARGLPGASLVYIPNWTDPIAPAENPLGLQPGSVASGEKRAVYSGNLGLVHDFDTILGAAALLQKENSPWRFVFQGAGPKRAEVQAKAARLCLENVLFRDPLVESAYQEMLQTADAHLVSLGARFAGAVVPSKIYPAVASGRPVACIGPAASETALWLSETGAGRNFANGDAAGLADFLRSGCPRPDSQSLPPQLPSREDSPGKIEALLRSLTTGERDNREGGF